MRRRTFLAASAATLALPSVARAQKQQVLKFIAQSDLAILDPIWTTAYVTRNHGFMVFDTLYGQTGQKGGFKATPQMIAGHVIDDGGKTWKLTLRDGLMFHDGERVLARDCVASIKRWGARDAFGQALMARTDELSAPDDKTILFRLKQPFALLPDALCHGASNMCAMMPQRIAETDPFKAFTEVVGSGPFKFNSERAGAGLAVRLRQVRQVQAARGWRGQLHFRSQDRAFRSRRMARAARSGHQGGGHAGGRDGLVGEPVGRPAAGAAQGRHPDADHRSHRRAVPAAAEPSVSAVRQAGGAACADGRDRPEGIHDCDDGRGDLTLVGAMRLLPAGLAAGERCRPVRAHRQARLCGGEDRAGEGRIPGREGGADGGDRPADQLSAWPRSPRIC